MTTEQFDALMVVLVHLDHAAQVCAFSLPWIAGLLSLKWFWYSKNQRDIY
jgi:hypothetical protein